MPPSDETHEAGLIDAARRGDLRAFEALMDNHLHGVRVFVALKAPVAELIDEVTHETFVFAYQHLGEFHGGSLGAWLRAIAFQLVRKRVLQFSREQRNLERYGEHARWSAALSQLETPGSETADQLLLCLEELPPTMRLLLDLRYREELTSEAIATRMDRTAVWVRQVLTRLRRKLKECLELNPASVS